MICTNNTAGVNVHSNIMYVSDGVNNVLTDGSGIHIGTNTINPSGNAGTSKHVR